MVTNALSPMRVVEALQDLAARNGTNAVMPYLDYQGQTVCW
jgi:hypothetical protein